MILLSFYVILNPIEVVIIEKRNNRDHYRFHWVLRGKMNFIVASIFISGGQGIFDILNERCIRDDNSLYLNEKYFAIMMWEVRYE